MALPCFCPERAQVAPPVGYGVVTWVLPHCKKWLEVWGVAGRLGKHHCFCSLFAHSYSLVYTHTHPHPFTPTHVHSDPELFLPTHPPGPTTIHPCAMSGLCRLFSLPIIPSLPLMSVHSQAYLIPKTVQFLFPPKQIALGHRGTLGRALDAIFWDTGTPLFC